MRKSRFADIQITVILNQTRKGIKSSGLRSEDGISSETFFEWCPKFDGMATSMMARLKGLEHEKRRLL